jgi:SAM-dependent methyltransferase
MDTRPYDEAAARRGLRFLAFTNRVFGGVDVLERLLNRWTARWEEGETVTFLDAGTGGADLPIALARWAREREARIHITAVEMVPVLAGIARETARGYPEITVLERDLWDLPSGMTFDYVTASLFLHHMPLSLRVETLKNLDRRARRGLIVSDLRRDLPAYWAVGAFSYLTGDETVRHDGPLSVRRAFRPAELDDLAREAGLGYLAARAEPWFRVSLAGEKT